jgi:hypothetical protein
MYHGTTNGGDGGNGVVVVRGPANAAFSVSPPANSVTSDPSYKLATFNVSGTLTYDGGG